MISAITPEGKLFIAVQEEAYEGPDVVRFLRHLLRHIQGKLLMVWMGRPSTGAEQSKTIWPVAEASASIWSG